MKKILLILVAALGLTATAQTGFQKGDISTEILVSSYTFNPTISYFLTDKSSVGLSVETGNFDSVFYEFFEKQNGQARTTANKHSNTGLFTRYYFLNFGKKIKVYSQLGVNNNNNLYTKSYLSVDLGLGINYFVNKNLALTTNITSLVTSFGRSSGTDTGRSGVDNPLDATKFGVIYKF